MKKSLLFAVLLSVFMLQACSDNEVIVGSDNGNSLNAPELTLPADVVEGELFVKFKPEVADILERAGLITRTNGGSFSGIPSVDEVLKAAGAYTFERVFPIDKRNEERTRKAGLNLWYVVHFDKTMNVKQVAQDMYVLSEVAHVQYSREVKRAYRTDTRPQGATQIMKNVRSVKDAFFNDPSLNKQWGYINDGTILDASEVATAVAGYDVNCKEAWEKCTGDPSIIVAVMDDGVMYDHEDLRANMWVNSLEVFGDDKDNDGNGYSGDVYGYNFVKNSGLITYSEVGDIGHGTHVAGTIAAVNNNNIGVSGIAGGKTGQGDGVKIMALQIFSGQGAVTLLGEAKAVKYAADNGAVVLQCSWGFNSAKANPIEYMPSQFKDDETWENACVLEKDVMEYFIRYAGDPNGVIDGGVIVFASGNEYAPLSAYPGAYKDFICVSSIGPDGLPAPYTNYGTPSGNKNMISAPGGDAEGTKLKESKILSTLPAAVVDEANMLDGTSTYGYMEGTSMACPHVSGVAALGLSYAAQLRKHYRAEDFRELLLKSVRPFTDSWLSGEKSYWSKWNGLGDAAVQKTLNLNAYRGKIGGLIDANILLENIKNGLNGAQPMKVPNVYVAVDESYTINLNKIFHDGVTATAFDVEDSNIAAVSLSGNQLTVKGTQAGITRASVTSSDGKTSDFIITVRQKTNNGWM